jgi:hypothetical protein
LKKRTYSRLDFFKKGAIVRKLYVPAYIDRQISFYKERSIFVIVATLSMERVKFFERRMPPWQKV